MSHIQRPFTLPKHGKLLDEINQTIIDIKIHNDEKPMMIDPDALKKLRMEHHTHSLEQICELLRKCYQAINEQRVDPRKY
jgi:riboflavin synthase